MLVYPSHNATDDLYNNIAHESYRQLLWSFIAPGITINIDCLQNSKILLHFCIKDKKTYTFGTR